MKKLMSVILLVLWYLSLISSVSADVMYPYHNQNQDGQYYAVSFDGEGEATVLAKIVITNYKDDLLKKIAMEIPGKNVRLISLVQEGSYQLIHPKISSLSQSTTLEFDLPQPISSQDTATIILYYKALGYVEKNTMYDFDFETIKVPYDLQTTRVSISVSEDLYLEGGESSVNYQPNYLFSQAADMASESIAEKTSIVSNQIQYAQGYVKTATGLDPWESFHVKGRYAESWFALNVWKIVLFAVIGILAIAAIILGFMRMPKVQFNQPWSAMLITSSLSAVCLVGLISLSWYILPKMNRLIGYQYNQIFAFSFVLLAFLLGLFILIGPSVSVGAKHGVGKGIAVVGLALVLTLLLGIILAVVFGTLFPVHPPVYYAQ